MFRLILPMFAALALTACAPLMAAAGMAPATAQVIASGPVVFADRTTADETAGRSIELAYKAARLVVETLVDTGVIHGANAALFQVRNRQAHAAVEAARAAYRSGNADSISKAVKEANSAVAQLLALAPKGANQ